MNINLNLDDLSHVHFVGIGGVGMGGIAEVMVNQGYQVSGSDINENAVTTHLKSLGAHIIKGHHAENIRGADIIVLSSAISGDNPEVLAGLALNIPIIPRAKMLAMLMQKKYGIAISGTHGKTTTTSLVASILAQANVDPTFVIGGLLKSVGANAQLGKGEYFVAEADESDASFLYLRPKIAVVTNIDADHLGTYNDDMTELYKSFLQFVSYIPEDGLAVLCVDDSHVRRLRDDMQVPSITYGFSEEAQVQITSFEQRGLQSHFKIHHKLRSEEISFVLNLAGRHNALNATAAIVIAKQLGISDEIIQQSLLSFMGIGRRFQMYGECSIPSGKFLLIDDYGHHPREIAATVEAIRLVWPERRLVMAYQPHRYTRTRALLGDFASVLSTLDVLLLLDVYSAGESPILGADGRSLCEAIINIGKIQPVFVPKVEGLPSAVKDVLKDGDILLLQGAGSIGGMAAKMAAMQILG